MTETTAVRDLANHFLTQKFSRIGYAITDDLAEVPVVIGFKYRSKRAISAI